MPLVSDILNALFDWAPSHLAWERDNIGLIVGSPTDDVRRILVTLDVTSEVIAEAVNLGADVIVSHHPLLFKATHSLRTDHREGKMLAELIRNGIALIAMHTNVDSAYEGLNYALAKRLGLIEIRPLQKTDQRYHTLLVTATKQLPDSITELVRRESGGKIFQALFEGDMRYELTVPVWLSSKIQRLLVDAEVDIRYELRTESTIAGYGLGAIGKLPTTQGAVEFLSYTKKQLFCQGMRHTPYNTGKIISRVAVCGGSGSALIGSAVREKADAFVTSDITHHTFLDYADEILLIDAGHHETEQVFISLCCEYLRNFDFDSRQEIGILSCMTNTNPIRFY